MRWIFFPVPGPGSPGSESHQSFRKSCMGSKRRSAGGSPPSSLQGRTCSVSCRPRARTFGTTDRNTWSTILCRQRGVCGILHHRGCDRHCRRKSAGPSQVRARARLPTDRLSFRWIRSYHLDGILAAPRIRAPIRRNLGTRIPVAPGFFVSWSASFAFQGKAS